MQSLLLSPNQILIQILKWITVWAKSGLLNKRLAKKELRSYTKRTGEMIPNIRCTDCLRVSPKNLWGPTHARTKNPLPAPLKGLFEYYDPSDPYHLSAISRLNEEMPEHLRRSDAEWFHIWSQGGRR